MVRLAVQLRQRAQPAVLRIAARRDGERGERDPHALIEAIDTSRAQNYPGVHLVLTGRVMTADEALFRRTPRWLVKPLWPWT